MIDGGLVASWYQIPVDVDGDLYGVVPHLFFDVGERLALLNEQTRERMPNVLAFMPMESSWRSYSHTSIKQLPHKHWDPHPFPFRLAFKEFSFA